MSRIIEALTIVESSDASYWRMRTPHAGDHVRFADGKLGRIEFVGTGHCNADQAHVCEEQGSAYLLDNGALSISGGPFRTVTLRDLEPAHDGLHLSWMWQWQNHNHRGVGMGCQFALPRPIFDYRGTP